jgi:uncharacterized protein (TIGR00369 family)
MTTPEEMNQFMPGTLPGVLGVRIIAAEPGRLASELDVQPSHLAPNGYLHAASVVALADTTCGFGARAHLPEGARGFTTIELKTNFIGTATEGVIECEATLLHGGRTTQVWDARVTDRASGRPIAVFRCTQLVLYPKGAG